MIIWKVWSPKQFIASCIWNLSEWSHIGLGRFAPMIFNAMMGMKRKNMKKYENKTKRN